MHSDPLFSIATRALPYWAAALLLVTISFSYLVAVALDHVPACVPFYSGCTTVSSTGRMLPESLIFRAGMLPAAVIQMLFWQRCAAFLGLGGQSRGRLVILRVLGVVSALSLMLYALTLGFEDESYPLWRRVGIDGFAVGTFAAEVSLIVFYRPLRIAATVHLWRWLVVLCAALPLLAIAAEAAKLAGVPRHPANIGRYGTRSS